MTEAGNAPRVRWSELFPHEFKERQRRRPVVYFPLGICEPHGQISALGLDTFKAEAICEAVAERIGGIVAPTQAYHIHEIGASAKFLEAQVGETNPMMTSVPSFVFLHFFLYQLRSFYNAGFTQVYVLSGHGGSHPADIKRAAGLFMERFGINIWVGTDFDLVADRYPGDHAGKYELSTLLYLRPELIDFSKLPLEELEGTGGRLARGVDAASASAEYGRSIMEGCIEALKENVLGNQGHSSSNEEVLPLPYEAVESVWNELCRQQDQWATLRPRENQEPVSDDSRWKPFEYYRI